MSSNIPAHQALRLQVKASVRRRPHHDWVRSSGRPRNRWIDQLRQNHQRPPADLWRAAIRRGHPGATLRSSTNAQWLRRRHSAKGDVSGQRAMEEEDTGMVSYCRQPSEEEGRLERDRLITNHCFFINYILRCSILGYLRNLLLLLLLVCVSRTITGQPQNSVFICRV